MKDRGQVDRNQENSKDLGKPRVRRVTVINQVMGWEDPRLKRKVESNGSGDRKDLKRSKICRKRSLQGSEHRNQKRPTPEPKQGIKRAIPSSVSSRNYKYRRPNNPSQGSQTIAGPSHQQDSRQEKSPTVASWHEGSGQYNKARETKTTKNGTNRAAERRPVRSKQATAVRPCPYYLRSRVRQPEGFPEERRNIGIERRRFFSIRLVDIHWSAKIKDEVEKLAYQLNEEAERTERPIRRLSRIIGKLEEGCSVTSVAAEIGIAHSIVSRLWRQFQTTGTAIRGYSSGRPRGTTPADDRYIVLQARRNRRQTAGEIARHTTQATGRPISRFTVARRLHGGGLFARRPVRGVPLTPAHRRRRSLWCREHRNWRDNEWGRVLFTDESRFSLSSDSHRILIWSERGSRNHPSNIIERDRYGGRGVLVWGGIMLGSRTDLHIFDAGSVNGTRYCNEILLPYVRLFRGAMGLQFLFMDDNAPCHRTVAAEQLLESEDIERMDWPARSPDLNPIEHVWDFLGRRLAARTLPPVTIRELRLALQDEWAAMPQQLIDTLILSMGRRCETCLAVRGDHIPY
ncbi:transposable element Tcb2 transposase [Trichonephila clavipes]|nr:transposable element Tcb2 transposase [Trichonephila clavipes]